MSKCQRDPCICAARRSCPEPVGYRIRSASPIDGALWPTPGSTELDVAHRCIAISIAAKSRTQPGSAIEVIHVDSGDVIFQKPPEPLPSLRAPA
jgi:hypothetical protein